MVGFLLRRIFGFAPTVLLILLLVGSLIHLIPGDPVDALLGEQALPTDRAALRATLGLDAPVWQQIWHYIVGVMQGNWGQSLVSGQPVLNMLAARLPATGLLALAAMGVALVLGGIGGGLGAIGHLNTRKTLDFLTLALMATPSFVLGPLLVAGVAVSLNLLPVSGLHGPSSLILPALTLGVGLGMVIARFLTESLTRAYATETLRTAKAKGASPRRQLWRHALPLAAAPVVQIVFLQLGMVLTGAVLTEAIFGWPGIGTLLVEALHQRDYPLLQGCLLFISLIYMISVLCSDVLMRCLDPRMATNSQKNQS
jgi:ABC-type dipeptide/oligopeptide/nickel transport system permease component